MHRTDTFWKLDEDSERLTPEDPALEYRGVELTPTTLESLVTWDVSGHAQCEQNRLNSLYRGRGARATHGGY